MWDEVQCYRGKGLRTCLCCRDNTWTLPRQLQRRQSQQAQQAQRSIAMKCVEWRGGARLTSAGRWASGSPDWAVAASRQAAIVTPSRPSATLRGIDITLSSSSTAS